VLRRLAGALLLLWLVLTITFALIRLAPGDAAVFLVPPSASINPSPFNMHDGVRACCAATSVRASHCASRW
jgi:ABC-type dipeptide/oligopeptide/nickel transport system permease component